ncbi:hypothetical protein [Sorangium sp. So ce1099]|uniref:hypothetical protein n=1 Tax=Sorangium sp. So ce1099 TaxID=3133331 RepID=UPI003F5F7EFD
MPRRPTGSLFRNAADWLYVRVLVGDNDRESFPLDPKLTEQQAEQRKELVADLAARLRACAPRATSRATRSSPCWSVRRYARAGRSALPYRLLAPLLATNPLPRGFLPKLGPTKAKACLYPDEDARLLTCTARTPPSASRCAPTTRARPSSRSPSRTAGARPGLPTGPGTGARS